MECLVADDGIAALGINITGLSGFYRQPSNSQSGRAAFPVVSLLFGTQPSTSLFPIAFLPSSPLTVSVPLQPLYYLYDTHVIVNHSSHIHNVCSCFFL